MNAITVVCVVGGGMVLAQVLVLLMQRECRAWPLALSGGCTVFVLGYLAHQLQMLLDKLTF